ncbi:MAG TPA: SRPBCC family protein [Acidimicrobiales bacterium]|nr:SRPBCC family protein [Acidimicrobiales bacterium]
MAEPAGGPAGDGRFRYEFVFRCEAPVSEVWPLVAEAERWKQWTFLTRTFLLRPGAPTPDGVGALRRFGVGPFGSVEEVVAFEAPHHLGYEARKGMPARHYRADIVLEEEGDATRVTWSGALEPLVPGTGPLVLAYARSFVGRFTRALVRYTGAPRPAGPPEPAA